MKSTQRPILVKISNMNIVPRDTLKYTGNMENAMVGI